MKWFWRLVILAVMVVAAVLLKCVYLRPPGAEPRAAAPPDAGPSPAAPDSPAVAPPTTAPPNASPGASQSSGAAAGSASTREPQSDLPIDPSQPMPERSLSTDGALERDKPARFLVEGRSDIYSAGLVAADPERGGVLPAKVSLVDGAGVLRFLRVAGKAGCVQDAAYGADGGNCVGGDTSLEPAGGLSGIVAHERSLFLVGLFLAGRAPETPPPTLDFSAAARGVAFAELAPQIGQVFFIGDGLTGTGEGDTQRFLVPSGATHLYLGYADGAAFQGSPGWYRDNTGGLDATIVQRTQ